MKRPLMRAPVYNLYRLATWLIAPLLPWWLARRARRGKESVERVSERFGHASAPRPAGKLFWFHAASVGEAHSALPLISALLAEDSALHVLLTTGTTSSAALMKSRLPERAMHQFVPVDTPGAVRRFIAHWQPDGALWVESELWPNLVMEMHRTSRPMLLINARMSERSFLRWRRFPGFARQLLQCFSLCLAQSTADSGRFSAPGAPGAQCVGNLKTGASPLTADAAAMADLHAMTAGRTLWLAASTHKGEEEIIAAAHRNLRRMYPRLLTVIVPRHAERGGAIADLLLREGLHVAQRGRHEPIAPGTDIYIADTMGELGIFYRLAPIVFIGGSLIAHGGQNPLEAAWLDCAIIAGPHMENFAAVCAELEAADALQRVADAQGLQRAVAALLADDNARVAMAASARHVMQQHQRVVTRIMHTITPFLYPSA